MSSTNPIDNFLGSGDTLARLQAHAGRLMRLQRQLEALLAQADAHLYRAKQAGRNRADDGTDVLS